MTRRELFTRLAASAVVAPVAASALIQSAPTYTTIKPIKSLQPPEHRPPQPLLWANARTGCSHPLEFLELFRRKLYIIKLDGKDETDKCWYVETDGRRCNDEVRDPWFMVGMLKTYDPCGDGRVCPTPRDIPRKEWTLRWRGEVEDVGGVLSSTLRGRVEIVCVCGKPYPCTELNRMIALAGGIDKCQPVQWCPSADNPTLGSTRAFSADAEAVVAQVERDGFVALPA